MEFTGENKSPKACEGPRKRRKVIDTAQFIDVWAEFAGQLRKVRKTSHVMAEMQQELLRRFQIKCTIDEVRTKMHKMLKIFRRAEKNKMGKSGGSPSECEYFDRLNDFLGDYKYNRPLGLKLETIDDSDTIAVDILSTQTEELSSTATTSTSTSISPEDDWNPQSQSPQLPPPPSKRKAKKKDEELLGLLKEEVSSFNKFCESSEKYQKERLNLMRESNAIQRELLNAFLNN